MLRILIRKPINISKDGGYILHKSMIIKFIGEDVKKCEEN